MATDGTEMSQKALAKYYASLSDYCKKAMTDVIWSLDNFMNNTGDGNIRRIYGSSVRRGRVKPEESVLRKCRRDKIVSPEVIPDAIEDLIGIRLVASNKNEAEALFAFLQTNKDKWFCDTVGEPKFTPYTIADRNKYSIRTGYQAFHIAFVYNRSYHPITDICSWPIEMQLTSLLWEFWANYSRKYFYSASGGMVEKLRPYTVAIAKALDNAEDLMATTINILFGESETGQSKSQEKKLGPVSNEG